MLRWFEHSQVFHPDKILMATGAELKRPFEDVSFKSPDGISLHGWYFPANIPSPGSRGVFIYCHGNAGNVSHRLETCAALLESGLGVFIFDYRGFGKSAGKPTEEGTYRDTQAAYQWLKNRGFSASRIIAFGESLGGAIATELAIREPIGGLILENTFSCISDIGSEIFPWLPVRWIASIKYQTCLKLPQLKVPVLIMHSRTDGLIGFHHAEKNFAAAREPKLLWEIKGDHNSPITDCVTFLAGIAKFLDLIEQPQPSLA
jgi:fermentation-respiration switch protein FrsA (DUF1100 family)